MFPFFYIELAIADWNTNYKDYFVALWEDQENKTIREPYCRKVFGHQEYKKKQLFLHNGKNIFDNLEEYHSGYTLGNLLDDLQSREVRATHLAKRLIETIQASTTNA